MRRSVIAILVLCAAFAAHARVIRVDAGAPGVTEDGDTWATGYVDLQDALAAAASGDEVWVAEGTYTPTTGSDRTISFELVTGVALCGGFAGTETSRDERDWTVHETILSGDLLGDDDPAYPLDDPLRMNDENSYHVVVGADDTMLDGFTITRGSETGLRAEGVDGLTVRECTFVDNAGVTSSALEILDSQDVAVVDCKFTGNFRGAYLQGNWSVSLAGCVFSQSTYRAAWVSGVSDASITDCQFLSNGGGMFIESTGDVTVEDCLFEGNSTLADGGAISINVGRGRIRRCVFIGNTAGGGGGAICDSGSYVTLDVENCIFVANNAGGGGAIWTNGDPVQPITNCTFYDNTASFGGAVYVWLALNRCLAVNSVFYGNSAETAPEIYLRSGSGEPWMERSCVQGGFPGYRNIDADPLFVDAAAGDLRLQPYSPCIDRADGDAAPDTDIDGNPRHDDPGTGNRGSGAIDYADVGAHEFQGRTPFVTPFAGGCVPGASPAGAFPFASLALLAFAAFAAGRAAALASPPEAGRMVG